MNEFFSPTTKARYMEEEGKPMEELPTTIFLNYYTCNHQGHLVANCF